MKKEKFEKTNVLGKGVRPMEVHQRNEQLRRDIYAEIRKLNKTLHTGPRDSRYSMIVEKFIDAMIPSKDGSDVSRLPINAKWPKAPRPDKVLCVFYLVSCIIQSFWKYLDDESVKNLDEVETGLDVLRNVNDHYKTLIVTGDEKEGYILEL